MPMAFDGMISAECLFDMEEKFDPKLAEGIAYFEKMLQVMPDDRTTLEFLCVAYGQVGEPVKQRKALVSLVNILLKENDLESADRIVERLEKYEEADARAAILRVNAAHNALPAAPFEAGTEQSHVPMPTAAVHLAVKAERTLVQLMVQHRVLDEELAAVVMQRLAELAEGNGCFLISALSVLEKENMAMAEQVAAYLADTAGTPPIPLEAYAVEMEALQSMPESLARVRGVVPFGKMGDALLVAIVNPMDDALRRQVESACGGACRFYLASPRTVEEILDRCYAETPQEES